MILYGGSGHSMVISDILQLNGLENIEIWDDDPQKMLLNKKISLPNFSNLDVKNEMIISIGSNKIRYKLSLKIPKNFKFVIAIHPNTTISKTSIIGEGTVVMAGAIINSNAFIGKHCIINTGSIIEHDCLVNDYCHISPNSTIAGGVKIGTGSHVGIGATVIQGINIGKWATIGAGSVIIKDVPDFSVVVGCSGKIIKYNYSINE